jgi:beta-lactam-binding protein with PASTA domain
MTSWVWSATVHRGCLSLGVAVTLALGLAVVAVVLAVIKPAPGSTAAPTLRTVRVPAVVGLTSTAAETLLSSDRLVVDVRSRFSGNVPDGQVVAQVPVAGARLMRDGRVAVVISVGPGR